MKEFEFSIKFSYLRDEEINGVSCQLTLFEWDDYGCDNYYTGISKCNPGDKFIKTVGRKLALKRAISNVYLNKEERTTIWDKYFSMCKDHRRLKNVK